MAKVEFYIKIGTDFAEYPTVNYLQVAPIASAGMTAFDHPAIRGIDSLA
jgi:hypothetical protein